MSKLVGMVFRLLALPGIVIHELAHYCFCCLVGARVHQAVYFSFGNPAGYVVHSVPKSLRAHFAIVVGPFVVNSTLAFLLFLSIAGPLGGMLGGTRAWEPKLMAWTGIYLWLGLVIAIQSLPSGTDATSLWDITARHVRRGNILALLGFPLASALAIANFLRTVYLDWVYAVWLLWLAYQLRG